MNKKLIILVGPKGSGKTYIASPEICLKRIKTRDQFIHVPISDERLEEINRKSIMIELSFDLVINNEDLSDEEIIKTISHIV